MKKLIILTIFTVAIIVVATLTTAITLSFRQVRPTSQNIKQKLVTKLSEIVRLPENIATSAVSFEETVYDWEMETLQNEVVPVRFTFIHAYEKGAGEVLAWLEMPQGADASIFNKVLPAVVVDEQSLKSALDPKNANLSANEKIGYKKIILQQNSKNQTTKITWVFEKEKITETKEDYKELSKYPGTILRLLYSLPKFLSSLAGG